MLKIIRNIDEGNKENLKKEKKLSNNIAVREKKRDCINVEISKKRKY
jgi:hypothetical protein